MTAEPQTDASEILAGTFGFDPDEATAHFIVHIPAGSTLPVEISEHLSWQPDRIGAAIHYGVEREDGQVRCRLPRTKWNEIAEVARAARDNGGEDNITAVIIGRSSAIIDIPISYGPNFLPMNSGVRPIIRPTINIDSITYNRNPIRPTPAPP